MPHSVLIDPDGEASRREFVETVDTQEMAEDIIAHLKPHLPPNDLVFQHIGTRPWYVKDFDRTRMQERPAEWAEKPEPMQPIVMGGT